MWSGTAPVLRWVGVGADAAGDRPVLGRLRGAAVGPPARGRAADHGQGRRLRRHPRRRRRVQAAELDERAEHARHRRRRLARHQPQGRAPDDHACTRSSTTRCGSSASIPACRRTASRPTCRSCWRPARTPSRTGFTLVRREYPTAIGPIDLVCRDGDGQVVAIEVKRRGEIDGVEQLARYIERLHLDSSLGAVRGVFVAQVVKPQARVLAEARGFRWVEVDYDTLRGLAPDGPAPVLNADLSVPDRRRRGPISHGRNGYVRRAMPQEVRGVVARAKGEPVSIETIVVPDPGPGRGGRQDPGVRGVPHRPALPRGRDQRRVPVPARPRGGRHGRGRRRRRHRGRARRLRDPQLAGGVRRVPGVPARRAVVLLRHPQRDPEDDAAPTAPSCRRRSASAPSSRRRSSPPGSARRSTRRRRRRPPGCSAAA